MTSKLSLFLIPFASLFLLPGCERAPELPPGYGDWPHHQGDLAASKYVPLDQITPQNFEQLEIAWRWESADRRLGDVYDTGTYVATPLKVGDRLYTATSHGQVVALDPGTGEQLWLHDPRSWAEEMPTQLPRHTRGVEYWTDGEVERIFVATLGKQLVSIDAATGIPDPAFGDNGVVDLKNDLGGDGDWVTAHIAHRAPPIVVRDTVVVGSGVHDYVSELRNPPGHVRAYDARTGAFKWRFEVIPRKGEPFSETWPEETIEKQGNTNVWTYLSADEELGYVYLPTSTPTNDYYGGERHGDKPVRGEPRRRGRGDGRAGLALPDGASRHLGLRHRLGGEPHRRRDRRPAEEGGGADVEDGLRLRVRPGHRRAHLADRGTSRGAEHRPRRADRTDAAVPHEAGRPSIGRASARTTSSTSPRNSGPRPSRSRPSSGSARSSRRRSSKAMTGSSRLSWSPAAGGGASYPRRLLGSRDGVAVRGVEDAAYHHDARQAGDRRIDHLRSARVRASPTSPTRSSTTRPTGRGTAAPEAPLSPADRDRHADR